MDNCLFFKRRSSSHHFLLALRHFDVMLCKYRSHNNGNEKGTETWRLTRSQNVTFSTPLGTEVAPAPDGGAALCIPLPSLLEGQGPVGEGEAPLGPGPVPGLPPAHSSRHRLHVTAICALPARPALRGHHLERCLKNSSAQERWKL